jgi:hypothetical protein
MKKIIFLFTLIVAISIISGYKQSAQNAIAGEYARSASPKDLKGIKKPEVPESKEDLKSSTQEKEPEKKPGILLMLSNDTGLATWSPSLWWSYQHPNKVQPGC